MQWKCMLRPRSTFYVIWFIGCCCLCSSEYGSMDSGGIVRLSLEWRTNCGTLSLQPPNHCEHHARTCMKTSISWYGMPVTVYDTVDARCWICLNLFACKLCEFLTVSLLIKDRSTLYLSLCSVLSLPSQSHRLSRLFVNTTTVILVTFSPK